VKSKTAPIEEPFSNQRGATNPQEKSSDISQQGSFNIVVKNRQNPRNNETGDELPLRNNVTAQALQRGVSGPSKITNAVNTKQAAIEEEDKSRSASPIDNVQNTVKPKGNNSWEEKPIKPMNKDLTKEIYGPVDDLVDNTKNNNIGSKGGKNPSKRQSNSGGRNDKNHNKSNNNNNNNNEIASAVNPFDDMPVGGARGATDFETLLEEKLQEFEENGEPVTRRPLKKEGRQFLKKNSRQHLSSRLDKAKAKKGSVGDLGASETVSGFGTEKGTLAERKNHSEVFSVNKNFGNEPLKRNNSGINN
jgi:hypothetical protein